MSNLLKFFVLICGTLILAAIVFQPAPEPPRPPATLPKDQIVEPTPHPANSFRNLNIQEVTDLERAVAQNPEDIESRKKLLIYYAPLRLRPMQDEPALIATRRGHILWMIEHHPDDLQSFALGAVISPAPRDVLADPEGYAAAKALWLDHLNKPDPPATVLSNAATFLEVADKPLVEEIYLRGMALYPDLQWSARLGKLYGLVLVGSNAAAPGGRVRSVSMQDAHSVFAKSIRQKLEQSVDAELLVSVGEFLGGFDSQRLETDFDTATLGRSYLDRALQLNPSSARAQQALDRMDETESGVIRNLRAAVRRLFP